MNTKAKVVNKEQVLAVLLFAFFYILQLCVIGYTVTYFKAMGLSEAVAGRVVAIACIIATLLQPLLGNVADRSIKLHWKNLLYILTVILIIISIRLLFFNASMLDIVLFCIAVVIVFCMSPFINHCCFYYNTDEHPVSFGPARAGGSISYGIVSVIIGSLMEKISPVVVPVTVLIAAVGTILILLIMPKVQNKERSSNTENVDSKADVKKRSGGSFFKKYYVFFIFFFAMIFIFTFQNLFSADLINIVNGVGGDNKIFGIATAIAAIVELPVMFFFTKIMKKFSPQFLIVVAAVFYIIRSVLFVVAGNIVIVYIAQVLQAFTYAIIVPSMVYLSDITMEESDKNKGQTIMGMTISIGTIVGFFLEGRLFKYGSDFTMRAGMIITAIGAVLAIIAYIVYRKTSYSTNSSLKRP